MTIRSGQTINKVFVTHRIDTGAAVNADSLPTGTLFVNGIADAATVTITNIATGRYRATVTLPTLAFGDMAEILVSATVNSVSQNGIIWADSKDIAINAQGQIELIDNAITAAKIQDEALASEKFSEDAIAAIQAGLATSAQSTTILARLGSWTGTGVNTILGAFRALAAKASALTPSDISSGTTFDNTTDSLEAVRDRGDAAWTTGGGGGGGGTVVTLPSSVNQLSRVEGTEITAFVNENLVISQSVYDASSDPVNLSAYTLKFVIATKNETHVLTITSGINVTGADSNTYSLTLPDTFTDTLGSYQYSLRDASSDIVLAHGPLLVRYAATE